MENSVQKWKAKKALYRIDEVCFELSCGRDKVYDLLEERRLVGHWEKPGRRGLKITGTSLEIYINRFIVPPDRFSEIREHASHHGPA